MVWRATRGSACAFALVDVPTLEQRRPAARPKDIDGPQRGAPRRSAEGRVEVPFFPFPHDNRFADPRPPATGCTTT